MSTSYIWGTGRRKSAIARVRLASGTGKIEVNGRPFEAYFVTEGSRATAVSPLAATETRAKFDVKVALHGGGPTGQAGAMRLGVARALKTIDPALEPKLREGGFLTRDSRMKERKKYGQRGARRRFQFSKR
jgi:small subunit ribosomal protein S9